MSTPPDDRDDRTREGSGGPPPPPATATGAPSWSAYPPPPPGGYGAPGGGGEYGAPGGSGAPGAYRPPGASGGYGPGGYGPGGHPTGGYGPGAPLSPSDQQLWAVLAHVLTLVVGFLAPLVIWLVFRGRGAFSEDHARESLNFQITMMLAGVVLSVVSVLTLGIGALLFLPWLVFVLVFVIIAAVRAGRGEPYRYPLTLRLVS